MDPHRSQMLVALSIVGGLSALGVVALGVSVYAPQLSGPALGVAGTVAGSLATGLNSPSGVAAALKSALGGNGGSNG